MGVTISTHNGSAVSREHNVRNPKVVSKEPHIDMNGTHEVWIDEPVRKAYDRLFGEAVKAYNAKQARPERRIKSYYNDICKDSKKHPVYEMIIGIYGKDENGSPICSSEQGKEIMRQFVENWKERNPNLELIGAYFHADEPGAEPHVHLDYIPVAHGYTRGIETQTGLVKALGEQGFEKMGKATAQIQWEKRENDFLTSLCEAVGLTVDHPQIEGRKHINTQEMKLQKQVDELTDKCEKLSKTLSDKELNAIDVTPKRITGGFKGLSPQQAQELVNTSKAGKKENTKLRSENTQLKKENKQLREEKETAISELNRIKQERQALFNREKLEQMERERRQKERLELAEAERDELKRVMSRTNLPDGTTLLERYEEQKRQQQQQQRKTNQSQSFRR